MSSVGPQLPPHLSKRKRPIDDAEPPFSPPHKIIAAIAPRIGRPPLPRSQNPDEVTLEEDSDDDYGPSIPISKTASGPAPRVVGPSLPPSANPDKVPLDSSKDDYRPTISTTRPASLPPKQRVIGPTAPPALLSEMPSHQANADANADSDSDSDYGPSLPPAPGSFAASQLAAQRTQEAQASVAAANAPAKAQRDDWMLVPPTDSDWTSRVDPTKLKNRKFASGKGAKAPAEKSGISAIWTETPEEKRQRLKDEVLGIKDVASSARASNSNSKTGGGESKEEREQARRITEYNEKNRGKSLYKVKEEMDGGGEKQREKEDDPSKRAFDREKDMAAWGKIGAWGEEGDVGQGCGFWE